MIIFPSIYKMYHKGNEHHGGVGWLPFIKATGRPLSYGMIIPLFYRVAYRDERTNVSYCYPIGIHLLVKYPRRLWFWSFRWRPSGMEKHIESEVSKRTKNRFDELEKRIDSFIELQERVKTSISTRRENIR